MNDNQLKDKSRHLQMFKVRTRFTAAFFSIVFPFFFITSGVFLTLHKMGFSMDIVFGPTLATITISLLCLILGYFVSFYLMNMIFSPLEDLSDASKEVAKGNYEVHLDYDGEIEEIQQTIDNFNFMVHELNSVEIMSNDFIANVSHEFKTPLSAINGYITLLQDSDLSEEERNEYIQLAFFYIEKLNDLTGNILQLSKLENQNTMNPPVTYRLDEQIREALVILEPKWSAKEIVLDIDMEEVTYTGQKSLLLQVWTNLIGNAIKFSNHGGEITIRLKKEDSDIRIIVSDNGIGMSEETQAHLFEKFYQGDTSRKEQGNGLGLPLCKKILDKCQGHIYVSSQLQKGSVFMVTLDI